MLHRIKFRLHGNKQSEKFVFTMEDGSEFFLDEFFCPSLEKNEKTCFFIQQDNGRITLHFLQRNFLVNGIVPDTYQIELRPGLLITRESYGVEILECPVAGAQKGDVTRFIDFRPFKKAPAETNTGLLEPRDSVQYSAPSVESEVEHIKSIWKLIVAGFAMVFGLIAFVHYFPKSSPNIPPVAPVVKEPVQAHTQTIAPAPQVTVQMPKAVEAPVVPTELPSEVKKPPTQLTPPKVETTRAAETLKQQKREFFNAIANGDLGLVKKQLKNVNISADFTVDDSGKTPLILAVINGKTDIINFFFHKKVNINAQDFEGNTALMWSIISHREKISMLLLSKGANTEVKREDGKTAYFLAYKYKEFKIAKVLKGKKAAQLASIKKKEWNKKGSRMPASVKRKKPAGSAKSTR